MNERIKELAEQCYEYKAEMLDIWFNKEKFAELIVRECVSVMEEADYGTEHDDVIVDSGLRIKRHFGLFC